MKEMYLLYVIPVVLLELVYGQVVNVSPSEKKVAEGIDVSVNCQLETTSPSDDTVYQWLDNKGNVVNNTNMAVANKLVLRGGTGGMRLLIREVNDDRAGVYKCLVKVNEQHFEGLFKLVTFAPITFSDCPEQQHAVLGEEGRILCKVRASEALMNVWYRRGDPLTHNSEYLFNDQGLIIINTTRSHGGEYMYSSEPRSTENTMLNPNYKVINLDIYEKPIMISPIVETTAVVNSASSMYCRATGVPTPTYKWFKDDTSNELGNTDRITVSQNKDQGILTFDPVTREDKATYFCRAYVADIGYAESSNYMNVQTPPVIQPIRNVSGSELSSRSIVCLAHGDPAPTVQWVKEEGGTQYNSGYDIDGITVASKDINDPDNLGTELTLQFSQLQFTNAGNYKCVATNNAGSDEKVVHLEVLYKPKFINQPSGPFYNWKDNDDGYLPCIAQANPEPLFTWTKNDLKAAFSVVDTPGPGKHEYTSKLMIPYDGSNDNNVFGDFKCIVRNKIGDAELTLTMEKAMPPGLPIVSIERYSATYIELVMQASSVLGPEVTHFKAVYTKRGGSAPDNKPVELLVERARRPFVDDLSNQRTRILIEELVPSTEYVITVYAKNAVGYGDPVELAASTKAISVPGTVRIISPVNSQYSNEILLRWVEPDDGGQTILVYRVEYRRVSDKNSSLEREGSDRWHPMEEYIVASKKIKPGDRGYTLKHLYPGTYYQVQVKAENSLGTSIPEPKVIKTKEDPNYRPVAGAPPLVRASVILTIVAMVTACLRNYVLL